MDVEIVGAEDRVDAADEAIGRQPAVAEGLHVIGDGVEAGRQGRSVRQPVGGHPVGQGIGAGLKRRDLAGEHAGQPIDAVDEAIDEGKPAGGALRQRQIGEAVESGADLTGQRQAGIAGIVGHPGGQGDDRGFGEVEGDATAQLRCAELAQRRLVAGQALADQVDPKTQPQPEGLGGIAEGAEPIDAGMAVVIKQQRRREGEVGEAQRGRDRQLLIGEGGRGAGWQGEGEEVLLVQSRPELGGQRHRGVEQAHAVVARLENRQAAAGGQIELEGGGEIADHQGQDVAEHVAHLTALARQRRREAGRIEVERSADPQIGAGPQLVAVLRRGSAADAAVGQHEGDVGPAEQGVDARHQRIGVQERVLEAADRVADRHQTVAEITQQRGRLIGQPGGQAVEQIAAGLQATTHRCDQIGDRRQQGAPAGQFLGRGQAEAAEQVVDLVESIVAELAGQIAHQIHQRVDRQIQIEPQPGRRHEARIADQHQGIAERAAIAGIAAL